MPYRSSTRSTRTDSTRKVPEVLQIKLVAPVLYIPQTPLLSTKEYLADSHLALKLFVIRQGNTGKQILARESKTQPALTGCEQQEW